MKSLLFILFLILSSLFISACAPKTETIYLTEEVYIIPELPNSMTDPVLPSQNPASNPDKMTQGDLLKWWTLLRHNLQEANQKLTKIRVWYNQQADSLREKNNTNKSSKEVK